MTEQTTEQLKRIVAENTHGRVFCEIFIEDSPHTVMYRDEPKLLCEKHNMSDIAEIIALRESNEA